MSEGLEQTHIVLKNVSKSFENSGLVLQDINLQIAKGDFIVLLGPSGSGKSTLLRLIAGLDSSSAGQIEWNSPKTFEKAFVFQESHLMPWRNLLENVKLPLELMKRPESEQIQRAKEALTQVGLQEFTNLYPAELSGGMKMRASLARALIAQPNVLLLDEPFAALDEQTRFQLAEDLRNLWLKNKMTIIFVTHSISEACFLGDRVLTFSQKPARIKKEIKVNLPKQRFQTLRTEAAFADELKKIYEAINEK